MSEAQRERLIEAALDMLVMAERHRAGTIIGSRGAKGPVDEAEAVASRARANARDILLTALSPETDGGKQK